jgi:hypothetical protein
MDLDEAVVAVGLAGEQRLEAALLGRRLERTDQVLAFGDAGRVALGLAELDQGDGVVQLLLDALYHGDRFLQVGTLAQQPLRLLRIVPEIGIAGESGQLAETTVGLVPVKDASSAVRATAGCRRRWL